MAHVAKYTASALGHLCGHYDRTKNPTENINSNKTNLNYNLAVEDQPMRQMDFIHKRLAEVKVQKRKDVNLMCDWVVTVPKDLPQNAHKAFFKGVYDFLKGKYGKDNIVSSYVHLDEITPHLHFAFIPVVEDKRKGGLKVSAKECITRSDLQHFHEDLQNYLEEKLKQPVSILNEATKEGNKSIKELKRGTAQREIAVLKDNIKQLQEELTSLEKLSGSQISHIKAMGNVITRHKELQPEYVNEFKKLEEERTVELTAKTKKRKRTDISL